MESGNLSFSIHSQSLPSFSNLKTQILQVKVKAAWKFGLGLVTVFAFCTTALSESFKTPRELIAAISDKCSSWSYRGLERIQINSGGANHVYEAEILGIPSGAMRVSFRYPEKAAGFLAIRNGPEVWMRKGFSECRRIALLVTQALPKAGEALELIEKNYKLISEGEDTICGRPAFHYRLESNYPGRPSREIWLDSHCLFTLKCVDRSRSGEIRGTIEFMSFVPDTNIDLKLFDPAREKDLELAPTSPTQGVADLDKLARSRSNATYFPEEIPKGFELTRAAHSSFNGENDLLHMVFFDGLTCISFFQSPESGQSSPRPENARLLPDHNPPVWVWQNDNLTMVETVKPGGIILTAMGDLSEEELVPMVSSSSEYSATD